MDRLPCLVVEDAVDDGVEADIYTENPLRPDSRSFAKERLYAAQTLRKHEHLAEGFEETVLFQDGYGGLKAIALIIGLPLPVLMGEAEHQEKAIATHLGNRRRVLDEFGVVFYEVYWGVEARRSGKNHSLLPVDNPITAPLIGRDDPAGVTLPEVFQGTEPQITDKNLIRIYSHLTPPDNYCCGHRWP